MRRIARAYEVRGLLEKATSYDNATVGSGSVVNEVQRAYNGFGQLATEYQEHARSTTVRSQSTPAVNNSTSPKAQYAYADGSANHVRRTSLTYPNGRALNYSYGSARSEADNLSRVAALVDHDGSTQLAAYSYLGASLPSPLGGRGAGGEGVVQVDYTEPDIRLDLAFGAGDDPYDGLDRFGRIVDNRWRKYSTPAADVDRIQHGYSRAGNRTYRENAVSKAQVPAVYLDELYGYDGLYQLKDLDRGQLNAGKTAIAGGTLNYAQEWGFDATGNWRGYREDTDGNGAWNLDQPRTHNKANEITGITGGSWVTPVHDRAGNMTTIPQGGDPTQSYTVTWDAWNRAVKYQSGISTALENVFDGLGRRVKKIASGTTRHLYFSDRWQAIEERLNSASAADRQFVWGLRYIDDLVLRDRDADSSGATGNLGISGSGLEERLYAMQDPNWNVIALSDTVASIQERYAYAAYGEPRFLTGTFGLRGSSVYDWETLYGGYRYDVEWQGYQAGRRPLHPLLGRWLCRDPIGYWGGDHNLVRYVGDAPTNATDPSGLEAKWIEGGKIRLTDVELTIIETIGEQTAGELKNPKWWHVGMDSPIPQILSAGFHVHYRVTGTVELKGVICCHSGSQISVDIAVDFAVEGWSEVYDKKTGLVKGTAWAIGSWAAALNMAHTASTFLDIVVGYEELLEYLRQANAITNDLNRLYGFEGDGWMIGASPALLCEAVAAAGVTAVKVRGDVNVDRGHSDNDRKINTWGAKQRDLDWTVNVGTIEEHETRYPVPCRPWR